MYIPVSSKSPCYYTKSEIISNFKNAKIRGTTWQQEITCFLCLFTDQWLCGFLYPRSGNLTKGTLLGESSFFKVKKCSFKHTSRLIWKKKSHTGGVGESLFPFILLFQYLLFSPQMYWPPVLNNRQKIIIWHSHLLLTTL